MIGKRTLALVLAFVLAMANPIAVFAEHAPLTVSENEITAVEESVSENSVSENEIVQEESVSENIISSEEIDVLLPETGAQFTFGIESPLFPSETWEYGVAEAFNGGSGTKGDPYQIANAAQLALFAHKHTDPLDRDKHYILTASIKLNDDLENPVNIWPSVDALAGSFDGNGHTINNVYISVGDKNKLSLLSYAEEVKNLTINGIKVQYSGDSFDATPTVAAIAQDAKTMTNCHVKGDFIIERINAGTIYAGGLAGYVSSSEDGMTDCSSTATFEFVNATQINAGGLAYCNLSTMSNCWFDGSLELDTSGSDRSKYYYCGGLIYTNERQGTIKECYTTESAKVSGYTVGGIAHTSYGEIDGCFNKAEVTGNSSVAGIVTTVWGGSVINCVNQGKLNSTYVSGSANANVSGIASQLSGSDIVVSGCTNTAEISGTMGNGKKIIYVSGIVYMVKGDSGSIQINNCVNEGKLEGQTVAGIVAASKITSGNCRVEGCENKGELISTYIAGGIIGEAGSYSEKGQIYILQCNNSGKVQGIEGACVGGIAGDVSHAVIESCYNVGEINARYLGGIAGTVSCYVASVPAAQIIDCFNLGPLYGESIGGIVYSLQFGTVQSCYNMGKITQVIEGGYDSYSSSCNMGGIVNVISTYSANVSVQDCFNCGMIEVGNSGARVGGIAASVSNSKEGLTAQLSNCYSVGTIKIPEGKETGYYVSDAFSYIYSRNGELILENIYFLDSDRKDYSSATGDFEIEELQPCTLEELKQISTYEGFDFAGTWKLGIRKYPFPMLIGVGEKYLEYDFSGTDKETVFAEYILQVKEKTDKDTYYSRGIPNATVSFQGNSYKTDKNGMIRFLAANKELGEVVVTHENFYEEKVQAHLQNNEIFVVELERKIEVQPPKVNVSSEVDLEGGSIESDDVSFSAIDFPFDMELTVSYSEDGENDVEKIPFQIEIDREKQEIKMAFGMKIKTEDDKITGGDEYYRMTKDAFTKCLEAESKEDVLDILKKNGAKTTTKEWGGSVDYYYMGYVTLYWNGQCYAVKESQALMGLSGSSEFTYRPAATAGIAYGRIELKLSADGTYTLGFDEELQKLISKYGLSLEQTLTLAAGVGCELAKIEVGAEGGFKEELVFDGYFDVDEDLTIEFNANPYVEGKLWIFSVKRELKLWNGAQLWPELKLNETSLNVVSTLQEFGDSAEYEMITRDYLEENLAQSITFNVIGDEGVNQNVNAVATTGADVLIQNNVYPDAWTSLCELSDGTKIATWIADAGLDRADADRTVLCYSVADAEGNFGPAMAVYDSGRGDYYPTLLAKGNSAYVAWVNADKEYGNTQITVDDLSENNSIYVASFDRSTNIFTEPVRITENRKKMPLYLKLASDGKEVTVTWAENSDNSIYMSTGKNSIYSATLKSGALGDTMTLVDNMNYLYDMDTDYINGKYTLVWNQDTDGDLTTTTDTEVFSLQSGNKKQLTSNKEEEKTLVLAGADLYFIKDGMICRIPDLDSNLLENTGIVCRSDFKVLEGKMGTALLWFVKDGFVSVPMVSYEKGNAFTDAVVLENMGDISVGSHGAVYEEDGSITIFTEEKAVDTSWEMNWDENTSSQSPFGNTNLRYYTGMIPADLIVSEALYYNQAKTIPGEELIFKVDVHNNSNCEITELLLSLKKDGSEVMSSSFRTVLSAGASEEVEVHYTLPADSFAGRYELNVTAPELQENNTANNKAFAEVGYANLVIKDVAAGLNEDGSAYITGKLLNEGYRAINDATIKVQMLSGEVDENGIATRVLLSEETGISLGVGAERGINITVEKENIVFDNAYDSKMFIVSADGSESETTYADNEESVLLHPIKAERVDLGEDCTITVGDTKTLNPMITPTGAYAECIYTSSDLSVAMVGTNGTVTALGEGTATIMAATADGAATDSITVTVEAAEGTEEADIEYYLDSTTLSIDLGEQVELGLLWEDMTEDMSGVPEIVNLTWNCTDSSVLRVFSVENPEGETIESGTALATATLTGLKAGDAIVTMIIADTTVLSCVVQVKDNRVKTVSFDSNVIEVEKGATIPVSVSTNPSGAMLSEFTLSSSDENVATVDASGLVTTVGAGEAIIEAVYNNTLDGEEAIKALCQVIVTDITQEKFSLRFDSNGGSAISEDKVVQFVVYGETFEFPEEVSRPGFYFAGWNTAIDGSGTGYSGNETIIAGSIPSGITLYAQWISQEAGMWIADVEEQVYTGRAIKPQVAVYDGMKLLTEGVDYTLAYRNNTNPADASDGNKAPAIIVKGRGNYTGSQTVTFTILPIDLGSVEGISVGETVVKANGKVQKPSPVVAISGKKLTKGKDYTLEYPDSIEGAYKAVGEYVLLIKGKGGYTGVRKATVTITNDQLMSKATVSRIANQTYTGDAITPEFTVKYGNKVLVEKVGDNDGDYIVSYKNNVVAGTATVILTGTGTDSDGDGISYVGTKTVTFTITGITLNSVKVNGVPSVVEYTGSAVTADDFAQKPLLTVTIDEVITELEEGKDYSISYTNNTGIGTATAIFTGMGGYTGTIKKSFKINPYNLADNNGEKMEILLAANVPYTKGGSKPEPVVSFDSNTLKKGRDYILSYRNVSEVHDGTGEKSPTVIIKGKGYYAGSVEVTFAIVKQDISRLAVKVPDKVYQNKNNAYKTSVTITDLDGKILKAGTDYEKNFVYSYVEDTRLEDGKMRAANEVVGNNDIVPVGTKLYVIVDGKGNYEGILKAEYRIVMTDISKANVTVETQTYTGKAVCPGKDAITVKYGDVVLTADDYDIAGYSNNIEKGTAKLTIIGKGNYGGTKTVGFKIKAKNILWWESLLPDASGETIVIAEQNDNNSNGNGLTFSINNVPSAIIAGTEDEVVIDDSEETVVITKSGQKLEPGQDYQDLIKSEITVKYGDTVLDPKDYEIISFEENGADGSAELTIRTIGGYGVVKRVGFIIKSKLLEWWEDMFNFLFG